MEQEPTTAAPAATPRSGSCLVRGLVIAAILLAAIGLIILWYNRPIRPVVLTEPEIAVVETKIAAMQPAIEDEAPTLSPAEATDSSDDYAPGSREISFTDRELNGLLNQHTALGDQIAFQFTPGAVLARIETPLPKDVPVIGGSKLRARAKFAVDTTGPNPTLALEDFTIWGISIPNDWLGGIKHTNLLGEAFGSSTSEGIPGVESLTLEKGRLLIRLKE